MKKTCQPDQNADQIEMKVKMEPDRIQDSTKETLKKWYSTGN